MTSISDLRARVSQLSADLAEAELNGPWNSIASIRRQHLEVERELAERETAHLRDPERWDGLS